jgi:hypothetical protein
VSCFGKIATAASSVSVAQAVSPGLSSAAIAGIAICAGIFCFFVFACGVFLFFVQGRRGTDDVLLASVKSLEL